MISLYQYIFSKAFYFCISVLREREFPQAFASAVVAMIILVNVYVFVLLGEILRPLLFQDVIGSYKYFAPVFLLLSMAFVNDRKRYVKILDTTKELTKERRKRLKFMSFVYLSFLVLAFFGLSAVIRSHNLG